MDISPATLTGKLIRLEPMSVEHLDSLSKIAFDPNIWRYMLYGDIETRDDLRRWIEDILNRQAKGTDLAFTVIHLQDGCAAGCTRYLDIRQNHRSVEIGGTWYGAAYQRTGVNTEAKYLLMQHAFEALGCVRVQLKTDILNERSQRAIERLGAVREGVLRNHMVLPDGRLRHSVIYSVIASEWPGVKEKLEELMNRKS
jgi:RimJ/RimL family protein N-acetyltransferase